MDPLYWDSLMDGSNRAFIIQGVDRPINGELTAVDHTNNLLTIVSYVSVSTGLKYTYTYMVPMKNILAWSIRND